MFRRFAVASIAVGLGLLAQSSWAGPVTDAIAAQSQAYNEFYEMYRASPHQSDEDARRIADAVVAPAETRLTQAVHTETRWALQMSGLQFITSSGTATLGSSQASSIGSPTMLHASRSPALDGKGVPKVVEFPQTNR